MGLRGLWQGVDRNLTDENGPYIELMTGMFTDNQPDFTFLKPYEENPSRSISCPTSRPVR